MIEREKLIIVAFRFDLNNNNQKSKKKRYF